MCIKTYHYLMQQQEFILRKYNIFEILIVEIYNLLKSSSPNLINSTQILSNLSPFLQERLNLVLTSQTEKSKLFNSKEEIITYIVNLLVDKISLINVNTNGYYYIQVKNNLYKY